MKRSSRSRWLLAGVLLVVCIGLFVPPTHAAEQTGRVDRSREFVAGLRERGYYDTAIEYLELVKNSPNVDQEFKKSIDFEAGVILVEMSRTGLAKAAREQTLADAWKRFDKFLKDQPKHPKADSARTQVANLLVERGRLKIDLADNPRNAAQKDKLKGEGRELYDQAKVIFKELEEKCIKAHRKFPKLIPKNDEQQIAKRNQVRQDLLQNRLLIASVTAEIARTYGPGSADYKREMNAAAAKYKELFDKYGTIGMLAGFYARVWEAECYRDMKDPKKAWEALVDMAELSDEIPAFRKAKNKGRALQLEVGIDPKVKKHKECVVILREWEKASATGKKTPDGLTIQYFGAEAMLLRAKDKSDDKDKITEKDKKKLVSDAKKLLKVVSREPGDHQQAAKKALVRKDLGGTGVEQAAEDDGPPATFVDAFNAAKDELTKLQDKELDKAKKAEIQQNAIDFFRLALRLKTDQTTVNELNVVRYYLTYMYYTTGDLYEAAVVGEFLATRYPAGTGAKQGSKIAMASYLSLYNEASKSKVPGAPPGSAFESKSLQRIATYIATRWAGEPAADEAWMMIVRNAVIEGDLGKALITLRKVPEESEKRGEAELMTGQAIWSAYLKESDKPAPERRSQIYLNNMKKKAQEILVTGIERMEKTGKIDYTLVASVLSLAQIYIGSGQPAEAIKWLDKPKIGAMTLVEKKDPVTNRGSFRTETYKAALRAYVSTQQLSKAEDAMQGLEKSLGKGDAAKLTKIYISLGRQLERTMERLRNEGKVADADKVRRGFELFISKIGQREQGNTFSSLNWVAETFLRRAEENDAGGKELSTEAKGYYDKAVATYAKILKLCAADPKFAPSPTAPASIRIRMARCLRRLGKYDESLDLLVKILKARENMVDAQVEAAYTYQARGQKEKDYYISAIKGGKKATRNGQLFYLAWGWGKIAAKVMKSPKHVGIFYEARYNLALCRFLRAKQLAGAQRADTLRQAEKDIVALHMIEPLLGYKILEAERDENWKKWYDKYGYERFDELLKSVRKLQGVKAGVEVVGLPPIEKQIQEAKEAAKLLAKRPAKETVKPPAKETAKPPAKGLTRPPAKEAGKLPAKGPAKPPAKK